jgi:NADH-quinone oxidoreductase subunit N
MNFVPPDLGPAAPEMLLMALGCAVLVADVYLGARMRNLTYQLTQASVVITAVLCIAMTPAEPIVGFHGTFVSDPMSGALKVAMLLIGYYAFFYARSYLSLRGELSGEYFVLGLFSLLGMMVLVSANSLLTVYLGLELMSLCLYAMVALRRESSIACEAAMKYFVLGALASGMLLYGISLIYGVTGSLQLQEVGAAAAGLGRDNLVLVLGLVFSLVGVAFKLGAVPFHMWVPDVYEGAPTSVTLFIGTAPKIAAFGMLMRVLVDGLGALNADWSQMLAILAVLSMAIGNVVALSQRNIKRMLAYSTISHVGFVFLGVIAATPGGYAASMFYIITYSLMALGAFGMVIALGHKEFEADQLDDFKGLAREHPWFAFLTLILMLSMAGVPPFLGFWAKWSVLREVIAAGHLWLAVVGVLFSVVGLFYYLRVVRLAYFDEPAGDVHVGEGQDLRVMLSSNALVILALGIYPAALMGICIAALG